MENTRVIIIEKLLRPYPKMDILTEESRCKLLRLYAEFICDCEWKGNDECEWFLHVNNCSNCYGFLVGDNTVHNDKN